MFFIKIQILFIITEKLNKSIIPETFDNRIKKIIINPFDMYKYLRKEIDFIKWTKFISDKIVNLYNISISFNNIDYENIGKMLYLLFNINQQSTDDNYYLLFLNHCYKNSKMITNMSRVNLKD
jgi:hypothetical protein